MDLWGRGGQPGDVESTRSETGANGRKGIGQAQGLRAHPAACCSSGCWVGPPGGHTSRQLRVRRIRVGPGQTGGCPGGRRQWGRRRAGERKLCEGVWQGRGTCSLRGQARPCDLSRSQSGVGGFLREPEHCL